MNDDTQKLPTDDQISKGLSCPKCSGKALRGPIISWKGFQAGLVVYFMSLFTVNKALEMAAERANAPKAEDFIYNPFNHKTPHAYVPPDHSLLYVVGALGLCIMIFLFFSALAAKKKCETCGHSWKA